MTHLPRKCIKKQRHHFADKGSSSQSYGFSSSHGKESFPWGRKESDTPERLN